MIKHLQVLFFILFWLCSINAHTKNLDPQDPAYLDILIKKLEANENVIFTKFGDGEYNCMVGEKGTNCDGDHYTSWLGTALKKSLIGLSRKKNAYIGKWHGPHVAEYCNTLTQEQGVTIPWVHYHLILNHDEFSINDCMYQFVKFIINSSRKKILICNALNNRLKDFFKADILINISATDWSSRYKHYKQLVEQHAENNCIILIAGGMCSKVLINDITDKFDLTFIDIGSGFDLLGSKIKTRPWKHSYEDELNYYKDFIPENWEK